MDNLFSRFQPIEQARWNQANIDSLFYAGAQTFVNRYFGNGFNQSNQQFYFNLLQQPVNMIVGYERAHRKNFNFVPCEGSDAQTVDQYTKIITHEANANNIHDQKSRAKEQACITGLVLLQPYLCYNGDDQAQGDLKTKLWEYNSFLIDPFARDMYGLSDCNFIWCQEYISKQEAESRFPDKVNIVGPMMGSPQTFGRFYFLPENQNMNRNNLMVLSYVWYKWKKKKKRLYSRSRNQFFDFAGDDGNLEQILYHIPDMEVVEVEVPCWKLATVLNEQLMSLTDNPLGFDACPFVPYYWNYEPHLNYYDLRSRGLVRTMRDANYLLNRRIIINHDISEATINAGWIRKVGAVANEDNLKKSGQGWDVIINDGYEMTDVQKIIPSAVPESDMALADQLRSLIFGTSGVDLENWSAQNDKQASSLTTMLKQAANLMVLQKYFDQWDASDKALGYLLLQIVINNWSAEKVKLIIGEEPSPFFYSKMFAKCNVLVEESDLTPTQQNLQAQQMLDINQIFGREVFPPSMIIPKLNITGKGEIIPYLQQQEQQAAAVQSEATNIQHAFEEAKLRELMTKALANIAKAREDHSRSESNLGLFEERLSMIERNRSLSLKEKQSAITSMLENVQKYGEIETQYAENKMKISDFEAKTEEELEKQDVHRRTEANKFLEQIMGSALGQNQQPQQGMSQQNPQEML